MPIKLNQPGTTQTRPVEPAYWEDVFSQAVFDNRDKVVVIEILGDLGDQELVRGKWLSGMVPQTKQGKTEIELTYEHYAWDKPERLTHYIHAPEKVWVLEREDHSARAFEIETAGQKVLVRFLDGQAAE